MAKEAVGGKRHAIRARIVLFGVVAVLWWILDRLTKMACDVAAPGTVLAGNVANLFDFQLVHNTGAAWGIFGGSTTALGVFSLIVCAIILVYLFAFRKCEESALETFSLALVFAGGLGNAFDRLVFGYVVDFIQTTFIEFPVFNVADIGVTCGIVLFLIAILVNEHRRPEEGGDRDA